MKDRPHPVDRVPLLCGLALAVRALVAWRTAVPERDAASYLWMASGVAEGVPGRLWDSVFHPVFPALVGALQRVAPALDPVVAGQVVACTASALAVWPLYRLTDRWFGTSAATAAALCMVLGTWFVRHPADVLSEGVFQLLVLSAVAMLAVRGAPRPAVAVAAGALTALAYGTRPEGASLGVVATVWLLAAGRRRGAAWYAVGCCAVAVLFPLGWWLAGPGPTLTPKAGFVWADGIGSVDDGLAHYARHALRLPGAVLEALGYVVAPAAVTGAVLAVRGRERRVAWLLLAPFLLQFLVVPVLRSNLRFVSGYGVLVLPFAGLAWARVAPALRARRLVPVAVAVVFAADLARLPQPRRTGRIVERDLGAWLGDRLEEGETVVSDMPRLDFFAGVEPGPPREVTAGELEERARAAPVRFVAWVEGRTPLTVARLAGAGYAPVELPPGLRDAARERGILVVGR